MMTLGRSADDRSVDPRRHARRLARRQAVDLVYQADVTGRSTREVARDWNEAGVSLKPYAATLVRGLEVDGERIDRLVASAADAWTLPRMAVLDRTILRLACYEILSGVPPAVSINEAVDMAKELSTEESGRFVNGVLGRVARLFEGESRGEPRD